MQNAHTIVTPFNNPLIRFISEKKYRWLRHGLFIVFGLILAFKGDIGVPDQFGSVEARNTVLWVDLLSFTFIMAMLYLTTLVLVPKLLFRSKVFLFSISFFIVIFIIYTWVWFLDYHYIRPLNRPGFQHLEFSLIHFIQVGAVGAVLVGSVVGMKIFKKWITDVQLMQELHETNLKTELEQLKSQVNPHFLFNTLNSLHVLMKTDPDKASQVLLELSDLLRYQLYDSSKETILLSKDIHFIQNLLALEQVRKNDFTYEIHTEGNIDQVSLPPFIFIPFIENAIKHGASTVGHSYLTLNFRVADKALFFRAENSKPALKRNLIGGLGLKNLQRRLELLYPQRHTLEIIDNDEKYIATLNLSL